MADEKTDSTHDEADDAAKGASTSDLRDLDTPDSEIEKVKGGAARSDNPIFDRIGQGM